MIQSIERGIEILNLLKSGPLGVTELASATALPKTTFHRLLKTFEAHHWVELNSTLKKYQLSWGILPMAKSFLTSLDVRAIAQPYMVAIRNQLQQSVNLFLAQGDYRICIERVAADKPLRHDIKIGTVYPVSYTHLDVYKRQMDNRIRYRSKLDMPKSFIEKWSK